MTKYVLQTPEGKKAVVDMESDALLYASPITSGNTRGIDIYAHTALSGTVYFYQYDWSRWQGESDTIDLISRESTEDALISLAGICGDGALTEIEIKHAKGFGFNLFEETA